MFKYLRIRSFRDEEFSRFAQKYLLRTLYSIIALVSLFVLADALISDDAFSILDPITDNPTLVLSIFFISEAILGVIPPDLFIAWAAKLDQYPLFFIIVLAVLSYIGGIISFLLGKYIGRYPFFKKRMTKVRMKFETKIMQWGGMVIVLAALTPIPFSPISMLSGSLKFPFKKYVLFSLTRIIRVIGYGLFFMLFSQP